MNRNLKHLLFGVAVTFAASSYGQSEIINISTGITGTTATAPLRAMASLEENWTVAGPNGTVTARVAYLDAWDDSGCSRWISAKAHAGNGQAESVSSGVYTYTGTFSIQSTQIGCATLKISCIGADNNILSFKINGHDYSFTVPAGDNHFDPLIFPNVSVSVNPAHLNAGSNNTVTVTTDNDIVWSGLNLCGRIEIVNSDIDPVILGPSTICQGNSLSFTGTLAANSGVPTHHLWRLVECDVNGNLTPGGFDWEQWYTGQPGPYTFPSSLNLTCGKYYMVVLAGVYDSPCSNWAQELKVIYYACKPTANAGSDKTVCQDNCVSIGTTFPSKLTTYNWSANGSPVGTGVNISVCPTTNTTYTLTVTNQYGCTATDQVAVTVLPNEPGFDIQTNTAPATYYTVTATPLVTNADLVSGFGAYWSVEELDANNNPKYIIQSPIVWYPYPAPLTFKGFDALNVNYDVTAGLDVYTSLPNTPATGLFLYNRTYRITRGTWNDNCNWNAEAAILARTKSGEITVTETEAPDLTAYFASLEEQDVAQWMISPNPSNGVFTISSEAAAGSTIEVYDLLGNKLQTRVIETGTTSFDLDLSGNAQGIYLLNINTNGVISTHKIILE